MPVNGNITKKKKAFEIEIEAIFSLRNLAGAH
jgi:hypothetical protein